MVAHGTTLKILNLLRNARSMKIYSFSCLPIFFRNKPYEHVKRVTTQTQEVVGTVQLLSTYFILYNAVMYTYTTKDNLYNMLGQIVSSI